MFGLNSTETEFIIALSTLEYYSATFESIGCAILQSTLARPNPYSPVEASKVLSYNQAPKAKCG